MHAFDSGARTEAEADRSPLGAARPPLLQLSSKVGNRGMATIARELAREAAMKPQEGALDPGTPTPREAVKTWTYELTFDDGPHVAELGKGVNRTEKVLDTLKAKGIKAGFFIQTGVKHRGASAVGKALVKRMHDEGHTVGIHTGGKQDHELHTTAQADHRLGGELRDAKAYIKTVTGDEPEYVRPPTGAYNTNVSATYRSLGLTNLLWDIDGDTGRSLDLATLKARFSWQLGLLAHFGFKRLPNRDAINVLYHDIQQGTADNLGAIIDHIKEATAALPPTLLPTLSPHTATRNEAAFRAP